MSRFAQLCGRVAALELPAVCLVSPLLLFPRGPLPLAGLVAILLLWLAVLLARPRVAIPTPLGLPLLILLAMSLQALYPSPDLSLSLPKLYGIVLGVAVFLAVARTAQTARRWWLLAGGILAAGVAVAAVGLVGTNWITFKLPGGAALYSRIPQLISSVQSSSGTIAGIHPNEVGGTLAFLLPLPVGLLLWPRRKGTGGGGRGTGWAARGGVGVVFLAVGGVLVLTQSRSALAGVAIALALLAGLRWRRVGYLLATVVLAGTVALLALILQQGPSTLVARFDYVGDASAKLVSRQEIWNRAGYMIEDFPFTGVGLNAFPVVLDTLYPSFLAGPDARIPHAHNIYLQTTVDLGLAGLMAFLGLLAMLAGQTVGAYGKSEGWMRGAVAGLGAGWVAYLLYGLTDAITLGAKPLVLLWAMAGLMVAANRGLAIDTTSVEREEVENSICGDTPQPAMRGPAAPSGLPRLLREAWQTLAWLYWAIAILFAAMAYLVVILAATGWTP